MHKLRLNTFTVLNVLAPPITSHYIRKFISLVKSISYVCADVHIKFQENKNSFSLLRECVWLASTFAVRVDCKYTCYNNVLRMFVKIKYARHIIKKLTIYDLVAYVVWNVQIELLIFIKIYVYMYFCMQGTVCSCINWSNMHMDKFKDILIEGSVYSIVDFIVGSNRMKFRATTGDHKMLIFKCKQIFEIICDDFPKCAFEFKFI